MAGEYSVKKVEVRMDLALLPGVELEDLAELAKALCQTSGPLSMLCRYLPFALARSDEHGIIQRAEGIALASTGIPEAAFVGTSIDMWGPGVTDTIAAARQGHPLVVDLDGVADRSEFRYRMFSLPDGEGGSVALLVDLTDVLEAEREVSKDRELLYAAIEAAGGGMLVQDADGNVISHNKVIAEILGWTSAAHVGPLSDQPLDAIHQDGRPFLSEDFPGRTALRTGEPQRNVAMGVRNRDGTFRWLMVSSFPIRLGGHEAVMTSVIDVTDRQASEQSLRDSEERFRLLAERAPLGIFIVDNDGNVLYVNPSAEELVGRSSAEIRAMGWTALLHPDDRDGVDARMQQVGGGGPDQEGLPIEYRVCRPDGSIRWVRTRGAEIAGGDGSVIGWVGTAADITDVRTADERVRESEERMRAIVETAAEGIVTITEEGTIVEFNAAAERLFGYDSDEVIGKINVFSLIAMEDRARMAGHLRDYLAGAPARFIGHEAASILALRKDGALVPVELAITELNTSEGRLFTGLIRDMSERKAFEQELEHLATHDPLTGLPNRALLTAQLESALARVNRHATSVGVLFVDIDRIKLVTEALGHRAGDDLILQVAARLRATAGESGTIARFSNDQFVAFLEDLDDVGDAVEVATNIIERVNEPFMVGGEEAFVNASIGIAFAPEGMGTAESLVSNADVAAGRAKSGSVTRYEVFDAEMRAWVEAERRTEIALRHGIERDEFELHYQPVVALDGLDICGFEALVRWNHPNLGLLPPSEFIPIAEDSGLIVPMGKWILAEAIRQSAQWQRTYKGTEQKMCVAINLSARQLTQPDLVMTISRALDEAEIDPQCVALEITETVLLEDVAAVEGTLSDLKALGVRLSLDDFGTGYSSLSYLCRLPIDVVKVDRSFVSQLGTGSRDASIVEMVVGLAKTLHLDVVAEGVETQEQATVLREWGCKYAQGFLFSRPKPVDEIEQMIANGGVVLA